MKGCGVPNVSFLLGVLALAIGLANALTANTSDSAFDYNFKNHLFSLLPIFPSFSEKIANERCRNDSRVFREQLANFRLWAVKMLDASTKLPDGVLAGNTFQLGHFDECLSVSVGVPETQRKLRGQYCLAEIEYSPKDQEIYAHRDDDQIDLFNTSVWHHIKAFNFDRTKTRRDQVYWALCIPESCSADDLREAMEETMKATRDSLKVDIVVKVNERYCQVARNWLDFSWVGLGQVILGGIIAIFGILVWSSTIYDLMPIKTEKRVKGQLAKFLKCFSAKTNFKNLRTVDASRDIIPIHSVRFMSMVVILMGHRFIANSGSPVYNAEFLENAVGNPLFIHLLMSPILVVDTFFLLSGFLTGNQMLRDFDTRRFKLISGYIHRYIRLTPVYMIVVFFYANFLYHIGSGPLWKARVSVEQERCANNWWTNLLYINNYFHRDALCMFQSWHLTCDFHFYLMAPPIVYLLWKKCMAGVAVIALIMALVAGALFALTFTYALDPVLMSFNSVMVDLSADPTFRITYIPTHTRFIPYLFGILASYLYYKKKLHVSLTTTHKAMFTTGAIIVANIPILSAILFYTNGYEYDRTDAAFYAALHRFPWCAAVGWMLLLSATGNGGILQPILSWQVFVPLSRLTYCVFLSHGAVQLFTAATLRIPEYNSQFKVFWTLLGDIVLTYVLALFMHLLLEAPILKLDRAYFSSGNKCSEPNPPKPAVEPHGEVNMSYTGDNGLVITNEQPMFTVCEPSKHHEKYRYGSRQNLESGANEER